MLQRLASRAHVTIAVSIAALFALFALSATASAAALPSRSSPAAGTSPRSFTRSP